MPGQVPRASSLSTPLKCRGSPHTREAPLPQSSRGPSVSPHKGAVSVGFVVCVGERQWGTGQAGPREGSHSTGATVSPEASAGDHVRRGIDVPCMCWGQG